MALSLSISNVECETCATTTGLSPGTNEMAPYVSASIQQFNLSKADSTFQLPDNKAIWITPFLPEEILVVNNIRVLSPNLEDISVGIYEVLDATFELLTKATFGPPPTPPPYATLHSLDFPEEVTLASDGFYILVYGYQGAGASPAISTLYPTPLGTVTNMTNAKLGTGYTVPTGPTPWRETVATKGSGTGLTVTYTETGGAVNANTVITVNGGGTGYKIGDTGTITNGNNAATYFVDTVTPPFTGKSTGFTSVFTNIVTDGVLPQTIIAPKTAPAFGPGFSYFALHPVSTDTLFFF